MNTIITTESVEANDSLYAAYKLYISNKEATRDDFYSFLTTSSEKRDAFVNEYATLDTSLIGNVIIVKCKSK